MVYLWCLRAVENKPSHPRTHTLASQGAREYCQTIFGEGLPRGRLEGRPGSSGLARHSPTTHRESKFRRSLSVDLIRIALRLPRRADRQDTCCMAPSLGQEHLEIGAPQGGSLQKPRVGGLDKRIETIDYGFKLALPESRRPLHSRDLRHPRGATAVVNASSRSLIRPCMLTK